MWWQCRPPPIDTFNEPTYEAATVQQCGTTEDRTSSPLALIGTEIGNFSRIHILAVLHVSREVSLEHLGFGGATEEAELEPSKLIHSAEHVHVMYIHTVSRRLRL